MHDRMPGNPGWRVALAHDWLTGLRGGERVLEALCRAFPAAPIYTLIHNRAAVSETINRHPIRTTWLQRVPGIHRRYRCFLPLFPGAVARLRPEPADLLISTSHCVAKGVPAPSGARHLCYCFTPMRYAWLFYEDYFGANPLKKAAVDPLLKRLRAWDLAASERVTRFVALSRHVQARIKAFYGRESDLVYPPVNTRYFTPDPSDTEPDAGKYDLIVSALVPYKRVELAVRAYTRLGYPLKIAGAGTEQARLRRLAGRNVRFLGRVEDARVRRLYRNCRLLVFPGEEDFGLVPVEAQACGRPVVAFARGGALETVAAGKTGVFFPRQTEADLLAAVEEGAAIAWDPAAIRAQAEPFGEARFLSGLAESLVRCMDEPS